MFLILFLLSVDCRSKTGPLFILLIYKPGIRGERVQTLHEQVRVEVSLGGDKPGGLSAMPGKAV